MHREQPALDEVRLLRLAQPDRAVGLPHGEVELLIGEDQLQLDIGIEIEEFRMRSVSQPAPSPTVVVTRSTPDGRVLRSR